MSVYGNASMFMGSGINTDTYLSQKDQAKLAKFATSSSGMMRSIAEDILNKAIYSSESPKMNIPQSIVEATDLYKQMAEQKTMPGYDLYRQQIEQNTAQGLSASRQAATSAADVLGATTSLYGQQSQALTNLNIENARQQAMRQQAYGQQLNTMGQLEQQQYYMNEYYPYAQQQNMLQNQLQNAYNMDMMAQQQKASMGGAITGTLLGSALGPIGGAIGQGVGSWVSGLF